MLSTFRRLLRRSNDNDPVDKKTPRVEDNIITTIKELDYIECLDRKRSSCQGSRGRLTWQVERLRELHEELQRQLLELRLNTVPNTRRTKLQNAVDQARMTRTHPADCDWSNSPWLGEWEPWNSPHLSISPAKIYGTEGKAIEGLLNLRQIASAHRMRRLRACSSGHHSRTRLSLQEGHERVNESQKLAAAASEEIPEWQVSALAALYKCQPQGTTQAKPAQQAQPPREPAGKIFRTRAVPLTSQPKRETRFAKFERRYSYVVWMAG